MRFSIYNMYSMVNSFDKVSDHRISTDFDIQMKIQVNVSFGYVTAIKKLLLFIDTRFPLKNYTNNSSHRTKLTYKSHATQEVRPYVGGFCVDPKDALEASPEAGKRRSVPENEEVVVLKPSGQVSEMANRPARLYHLAHNVLGLASSIVGQGCYVQLVSYSRSNLLSQIRKEILLCSIMFREALEI